MKILGVISGQEEEIMKTEIEQRSISDEIASIRQRLADQKITLEDLEKLIARREQVMSGLGEIQALRDQKTLHVGIRNYNWQNLWRWLNDKSTNFMYSQLRWRHI
jgi:SMC interacting uncharacterized protein involved in chromosome segregation